MASNTSARSARLNRLFHEVINGSRKIQTALDAKLFQEAIRGQPSPQACLELLVPKAAGLEALGNCLRMDLSPNFIRSHTLPLLDFVLADPGTRALADGLFLRRAVVAVVSPPTLWDALMRLTLENGLYGSVKSQEGIMNKGGDGSSSSSDVADGRLRTVAQLALEVASLPADADVSLLGDVTRLLSEANLLAHPAHDIREVGYKLKKILAMRAGPKSGDAAQRNADGSGSAGAGPGGRHDNDFASFRDIAIYPTRDELLSKDEPFMRTAADVFAQDVDSPVWSHLDNLYRLTREDVLVRFREELNALKDSENGGEKKKKGARAKRSGAGKQMLSLGELRPVRMNMSWKCSVAVECRDGLEFIKGEKRDEVEQRKEWLKGNRDVVKHRSFGCLHRGDVIYGWAYINREVDELALDPPIVCLEFTEEKSFRNGLAVLKTSPTKVRFDVMDLLVFVYEPILKRLKTIFELPLHDVILDPGPKDDTASTSLPTLASIVDKIQAALTATDDTRSEFTLGSDFGIGTGFGKVSDYAVDRSQGMALWSLLAESVSCIQGPPGTGKTFIGCVAARVIHQLTTMRILVLGFTNHAIDQFAEDLMDIGIQVVTWYDWARNAPRERRVSR